MKTQVHQQKMHTRSGYLFISLTLAAIFVFFGINISNLTQSTRSTYSIAIPSAKPFAKAPNFNTAPEQNLSAPIETTDEEAITTEEWMFDTEAWLSPVVETELPVEAWMHTPETWGIAEQAEPVLEVEEWMTTIHTFEVESNDEAPMSVEEWMSDLDGWATGPMNANAKPNSPTNVGIN